MPGRYNLNCQNRGQKNNRFPGETSSDEWEVLQVKLWILPFEVCIPSIMAAGNSITNAFNASPSRGRSIITVGSTDIDDKQSSFSNYGECVDIFASGRETSRHYGSTMTSKQRLSAVHPWYHQMYAVSWSCFYRVVLRQKKLINMIDFEDWEAANAIFVRPWIKNL